METNIQSQLTETTQPVVEPNLNGINVYGSKTDDGIIKDLTMSVRINVDNFSYNLILVIYKNFAGLTLK